LPQQLIERQVRNGAGSAARVDEHLPHLLHDLFHRLQIDPAFRDRLRLLVLLVDGEEAVRIAGGDGDLLVPIGFRLFDDLLRLAFGLLSPGCSRRAPVLGANLVGRGRLHVAKRLDHRGSAHRHAARRPA
jgi:hypothetical protein